jgi:hypothetical protein
MLALRLAEREKALRFLAGDDGAAVDLSPIKLPEDATHVSESASRREPLSLTTPRNPHNNPVVCQARLPGAPRQWPYESSALADQGQV